LLFGSKNLCLWCFDLLSPGVSALPLITRRHHLKQLLKGQEVLRLSETFADPIKLLQACEDMCLEGILSKKADQPYKSGNNVGWIKVKTVAWRAANADRCELFEKRA
jgi:bifunctional non-homologous end joining protein LigD